MNLSDPIATINYLFLDGPSLPCEDAADADDDGRLTISDPIAMLLFLFQSAPLIRSPGPDQPWIDTTPDNLGCADAN